MSIVSLLFLGYLILHTLSKLKNKNDILTINEKEISEQKILFESLITFLPEGLIGIDENKNIVIFNNRAEIYFGYSKEEIIGKPLDTLIPIESLQQHHFKVKEYFEHPINRPMDTMKRDLMGKRKDGSTFYVDISLSHIKTDNRLIAIAVIKDISELVKTRKKEQQLYDVIKHSVSMIGIASLDSSIVYLNSSFKKALGIEGKDVTQYKIGDLLTPDCLAPTLEVIRKIKKEGKNIGLYENTLINNNTGKTIPILQGLVVHYNDYGKPEFVSTTAIDISEIKQKENELQKLAGIIETSPSMVGIATLDRKFVYLNNAVKEALEIPVNEPLSNMDIFDFLTTKSKESFEKKILPIVLQKGEWKGQQEWKSRSGKIIAIIQVIMLHKDTNGIPEYISTTAIDISEIKEKEKELQKLATIIENSPSMAGIASIDRRLIYANASMKNALEIEGNEQINNEVVNDFYTDESLNKYNDTIRPQLQQFGKWVGETELVSKSGKILPVIQVIMLHTDDEGKPLYTSTTAINIADLKEKEKELEKLTADLRALNQSFIKVKENERKAIAKDIHDELGQNLTAIKLNAVWIKSHLDIENVLLNEKMDQLIRITEEVVQTSRKLYNSIYPQMLIDIGLTNTIQWHANNYLKPAGIDFEIESRIKDDYCQTNPDLCLVLYRIFQECVTNILRYSKANLVTIDLCYKDEKLKMIIKDDGIGFEIDKVDTTIHHGLIGMRERVFALNGTLTIESEIGNGTITKVIVPLKEV